MPLCSRLIYDRAGPSSHGGVLAGAGRRPRRPAGYPRPGRARSLEAMAPLRLDRATCRDIDPPEELGALAVRDRHVVLGIASCDGAAAIPVMRAAADPGMLRA